jgi:hypothetical protein
MPCRKPFHFEKRNRSPCTESTSASIDRSHPTAPAALLYASARACLALFAERTAAVTWPAHPPAGLELRTSYALAPLLAAHSLAVLS